MNPSRSSMWITFLLSCLLSFLHHGSSSSLSTNLSETMDGFQNYTAISDFRLLNRRKLGACLNPNPYIEIDVSPKSALADDQMITVTVSGVLHPSKNDWVGMISPSHADVDVCPHNLLQYEQTGDFSELPLLCHYPVKAQYVSNDPGYIRCKKKECKKTDQRGKCLVTTCSASITFHVINIRTSIQFVFFGAGFQAPCVLAKSKVLEFQNPKKPLYGHLSSVDSTGTSMRLTWVSGDKNPQQVQYANGKSQTSRVTTFSQDDMCSQRRVCIRMASQSDVGPSEYRRTDPGWKYNFLLNPNDKNAVTCKFCQKVTKGGIFRAKLHQIGGNRNVKDCSKCPQEVKDELKAYVISQKVKKANEGLHQLDDEPEDDEVVEIPNPNKRKKTNVKGPLDLYMTQGKGKTVQTSINDACDKEMRGRTIQTIAAFFYQAGIAFNVANMDSFKEMIAAVGNYGPHLKPPSYHELRVPLLKNEVEKVEQWVEGHKLEWSKFGCSIMSDGWTDRRQRTLINFLVNSGKGTVFMESVDASSYMKTGEKVFELLDQFVERIGEKNVVQIITDNGSNFKLAGKMLMEKRKNLFWTPCAAHCLDLMLEDIGKIGKVKKTIEKGIFLVGYIYNHTVVLNMMREFTKNNELARCGVTRFATTFLTLQSLHKQKSQLRNMFASEKWTTGKWAKERKGIRANDIVFTPTFWNNVLLTLKMMGPLVRVLRLVDNEKKPAMGYVYEAMERAKIAIATALGEESDDYYIVSGIIDKRWNNQLHHPLHAAGYYFNPEFYCYNETIENDKEVSMGLHECIKRLVPDKAKQDLIMAELIQWINQEGFFGLEAAKRQHGKCAPAEWWKLYGKGTPNLQQLAIRVLSLTCSASGCERNWSTFEHIHSKKRNRLEHQKLHDLVYVKYNKMLKNRRDSNAVYDPILLNEIDDSNEWLTGRMEEERVFEEDGNFTWNVVGEASGAGEVRTTRSSQPSTSKPSTSRRLIDEDTEDEQMDEEDQMDEPEYYDID